MLKHYYNNGKSSPAFPSFPPFRTRPKSPTKGAESVKFCKTFFHFTRYNEGCFRTTSLKCQISQQVFFAEHVFTKALCLVCAGALALEPRCLQREADSAASACSVFFRARQRVKLRLPELQLQRWSGREGLLGGIRALDYMTLPGAFASRRHQALGHPGPQRGSGGADRRSLNSIHHRHITDALPTAAPWTSTMSALPNSMEPPAAAPELRSDAGRRHVIDGTGPDHRPQARRDLHDINIPTFPDSYSDSTDAGGGGMSSAAQKAVFTVTLNCQWKRLPGSPTAGGRASAPWRTTASRRRPRAPTQEQLLHASLNTAVMDYLLKLHLQVISG